MIKSFFVVLSFACLGTAAQAVNLDGYYQTYGCVNYKGQNDTLWSTVVSIHLSSDGQIAVSDQVFEGPDCKTAYFASHKYGTYLVTGDNLRFSMNKSNFIVLSNSEELKDIPSSSDDVIKEEGYYLLETSFTAATRDVSINYGGFRLGKIGISNK